MAKPDYADDIAINLNKPPRILQQTGKPNAADIEKIDQLLLVIPEKQHTALWRRIPQANRVKSLLRRRDRDAIPRVVTRLPNKRQTGLAVALLAATADTFAQLALARKLVASATAEKPRSLGIWVLGFDADKHAEIVANVTAAAIAAAFVMPAYQQVQRKPVIGSIRIIGLEERLDLERVVAETAGTNLVRWLTAMPANRLNAVNYAAYAKRVAADNGWQFHKFDVRELEKLGAGAFLAVAQGNDNDSAAIVRLKYRPHEKGAAPDLCLVGKGIIFDTGGSNLKPFESMLDMHMDMSGSAVALATLLVISVLQLPIAVDCWLALTENRTGPRAYKSQDVLTAANGKTIQTIHTDAEGRLALADTLVLACREKPGMIIDYATLTGACITGITTRYSGVFSNRANLHPLLKRAGRASGERVWPFPSGEEFVEVLRSDTADIRQCNVKGGGDHIYAASFLGEFVDREIPWIHVDLSACKNKGGLAHVATDITGFGVRFTLNLLLEQRLLDFGVQHAGA